MSTNGRFAPKSEGHAQAAIWAQGLLTLVTIVLGVALSVAAQKVYDATMTSKMDLQTLVTAANCFFIITGTYFHCYTFTSFYYILPSILWVWLPTAVGVGVVMCAYSIGHTEHFLISAFIFYLAGAACFAFVLVERRNGRIGVSMRQHVDMLDAYRVFATEMRKNLTCFAFMPIPFIPAQLCVT